MPEMEATIQSNQIDVDKEEARPNPEVSNLPQERHIWRMPELPPFPKSSQRRGVGKIPKPLEGGHELLLTHQELSGSGEDHRALRSLEPIVLQIQSQKDKELVEEPKSFIHIPEDRVGNDAVTTMEIHPLGSQNGTSMPYPIYGNLAISIIIGQIGHCHFLWN
ncbi:hypothetical protein O181_119477 [Austropuccinia psidii MF-1]|uniref:Uncharacterized protein n=1 Tax=Austropuccinia psidii MF-1 TaxID=1389203 RepID=A0A9Q3KF64_9BASI|nr:hypothetical protein [Austropuccinia psidii MF-1]